MQSFTYSDAPAGNITAEADIPSSAKSPAAYSYDAQARVTSMTPGTGSELSYGFDPSGNLTSLPTGAAATYDHDSELTSSISAGTTTSYAYNADGERLTAAQGASTIASGTWNGAGQLTAYDDSAADMTAATYDGNGLRASATSSTTQAFTWDTTTTVPRLLMDSGSAYIYAGSGTPAEQVSLSTGAATYLLSDLLGSVRGIVSSIGALTATTAYDAWGNPETSGGLTSQTPFGYAGAYTDPTGLIYLVDRYYDPATGQFFSVDPDISQTSEPYEYANDNPVSNTDPSGALVVKPNDEYTDIVFYFNRAETKKLANPLVKVASWIVFVAYGWLRATGRIPEGLDDFLVKIIAEALPAINKSAKDAMKKQGYCVQLNWSLLEGSRGSIYSSTSGPVETEGPHKGKFLYYCSGNWVKARKKHKG